MKEKISLFFEWIKKKLYFVGASYFAYFAQKRLEIWQPRIVVVTGSAGKTTAFSLIEAQLGPKAFYSHHANSAYGVPFNILGLTGGDEFSWKKWLGWIWQAPQMVKRPVPYEKIYIVECDCDRPGEGDFLSKLLKPEITIWLNVIGTHALNFDALVKKGKFKRVEEAIAHEFGFFVARAKKMVIVNGDSGLIGAQLARIENKNIQILSWAEKDFLKKYSLNKKGSVFSFVGGEIQIPYLLPKGAWLSVAASQKLAEVFGVHFDRKFESLILPPGRSSLFKGIRETTIIDSTYNSSPLAVKEMLNLFDVFEADKKWLVLGDMMELGVAEKKEHEKLADEIRKCPDLKRIILLGQRLKKYTLPLLENYHVPVLFLEEGEEIYRYLMDNLSGGETLLFKGSQAGLWEGIIELILFDPEKDVQKLPRRSEAWERRRQNVFKLDKLRNNEQLIRQGRVRTGKKYMEIEESQLKRKKLKRGKIHILPDWNYSIEEWQVFGKILEGDGWEVKILPLPGLTGEPIKRVWEVVDYASWLDQKLKMQKKVILLGYANGGKIALSHEIKFPGKVKKLILIGSEGFIEERWGRRMGKSWERKLIACGERVFGGEKGRKILDKIWRTNDYYQASDLMRKTMLNIGAIDLANDLSQIKVPTLLIWGKNDNQTLLKQGQKMQRMIPDASLKIIDEAKHNPQLTHSSQVLEFINESSL